MPCSLDQNCQYEQLFSSTIVSLTQVSNAETIQFTTVSKTISAIRARFEKLYYLKFITYYLCMRFGCFRTPPMLIGYNFFYLPKETLAASFFVERSNASRTVSQRARIAVVIHVLFYFCLIILLFERTTGSHTVGLRLKSTHFFNKTFVEKEFLG